MTSAEFDREEALNREDMELEFAIKDAGSWTALRQEHRDG